MSTDAPAKSGSGLKIVFIVLAILFVLFLLICGGGIAALYFGANAIQNAAGEEFKKQLEGNPVIVEEIGEDFTMTMDMMEVINRAEDGGDEPRLVFSIQGSKGEGVITAASAPGNNKLRDVQLETSDGRILEVPLEDEPEAIEDTLDPGEIDLGDTATDLIEGDSGTDEPEGDAGTSDESSTDSGEEGSASGDSGEDQSL